MFGFEIPLFVRTIGDFAGARVDVVGEGGSHPADRATTATMDQEVTMGLQVINDPSCPGMIHEMRLVGADVETEQYYQPVEKLYQTMSLNLPGPVPMSFQSIGRASARYTARRGVE
jgi:hypothetical protein